ncbi:MAG TPA: heavy-metal-associated domain-containing protein [Bacteroidales bacterium]|nr:heavy-metal-associated domain-containing protein [Bacteroidales bacterium]
MKTLDFLLTVLLAIGLNISDSAQTSDHIQVNMSSTKTESFKVWGKCDMCKARIEKTVKAEGVISGSWDAKTQMLTVTYDSLKTSKDVLSKKLASVGHDTEKYKAADDVYAKLPGCCHYERAK